MSKPPGIVAPCGFLSAWSAWKFWPQGKNVGHEAQNIFYMHALSQEYASDKFSAFFSHLNTLSFRLSATSVIHHGCRILF